MKNKKNTSDPNVKTFGEFKKLRLITHHLSKETSKLISSNQHLKLQDKIEKKINKENQILAIFNKENKTEAERTLEIQSYLLENFIKHLPDQVLKDLLNTEYVKTNIKDLQTYCPQLLEKIDSSRC